MKKFLLEQKLTKEIFQTTTCNAVSAIGSPNLLVIYPSGSSKYRKHYDPFFKKIVLSFRLCWLMKMEVN